MQPSRRIDPNHRILIIDDNRAIHDDFRNILVPDTGTTLDLQDDEALLFDDGVATPATQFEIDSAYQGQDALKAVRDAVAQGRPYALAFVDIRMPPGWDGVETIARIREVDANLQTVICTAYADYSWKDIQKRLGFSDSLLILKKPFDNIEVMQLAHALTRKWLVSRQAEVTMEDLDAMVAEQLKRQAKAQEAFRIVFESSAIAIVLTDAACRVVDVNRAAEMQSGLGKAEFVGKTPSDLGVLEPADQEELCRETALRGAVDEREIAFFRPGGERRVGLVWSRAVEIHGNTRFLVFLLDISDRKRMEEELRHARTAAEAGARAKSEFLANMSHEIRTPMNAICGFTQLALATSLTKDQRDYLETVDSSADALLRIINDILDLSKIEAGRMDLEQAPFSLRECLESAARLVLPEVSKKGLELGWKIGADVPDAVSSDAVRLRQVLLNLLGNAVKFTAAGFIQLEVRAILNEGRDITVQFDVRDTGIGIPLEKQRCIFEPFRQADGSVNRKYGGTGLGLAISARLVELAGGRIWVESEEGRGSVFSFTMKLRLAEVAERWHPKDECESDRAGSAPLTVLVVEDNQSGQALVSSLLKRQGHSAVLAANGLEALSLLDRQSFDAILMDIQMPNMDGFETTAEIRRRETASGRHVPIIALTACAMKGDRERCFEGGMDEYFAKPFDIRRFMAAIDRISAKNCASEPWAVSAARS